MFKIIENLLNDKNIFIRLDTAKNRLCELILLYSQSDITYYQSSNIFKSIKHSLIILNENNINTFENITDSQGRTPIYLAILTCDIRLIELILSYVIITENDLIDNYLNSPLIEIIERLSYKNNDYKIYGLVCNTISYLIDKIPYRILNYTNNNDRNLIKLLTKELNSISNVYFKNIIQEIIDKINNTLALSMLDIV